MPLPFLDRYSAEAQVGPSLVLVLPPILSLLAVYPPARTLTSISIVATAGAVSAIVLSHVVRDRGKAAEVELFRKWGGAPTTRLLRHRLAESPGSVRKLHRSVTEATGQCLPDPGEEALDPCAADVEYEAAVALLRERTRNADQFPVVLVENASYGMRRNLWAVRTWGRAFTALGALTGLVVTAVPVGVAVAPAATMVILNLAAFAFWQRIVSERWVQQAAERYAEALFRACAVIQPDRPG